MSIKGNRVVIGKGEMTYLNAFWAIIEAAAIEQMHSRNKVGSVEYTIRGV